jgi:hypothetical protein
LYDAEHTLTSTEKAFSKISQARAKYFHIDFDKKVAKRNNEKMLIDDKTFSQHYAYKLLTDNDNVFDKTLCLKQCKKFKIPCATSFVARIDSIKKLEKALDVQTLDIDSKRDKNRYNEEIDFGDNYWKTLKQYFRIKKEFNNSFDFLYHVLIQAYKNMLGNDIIDSAFIRSNGGRQLEYTTNNMTKDGFVQ